MYMQKKIWFKQNKVTNDFSDLLEKGDCKTGTYDSYRYRANLQLKKVINFNYTENNLDIWIQLFDKTDPFRFDMFTTFLAEVVCTGEISFKFIY